MKKKKKAFPEHFVLRSRIDQDCMMEPHRFHAFSSMSSSSAVCISESFQRDERIRLQGILKTQMHCNWYKQQYPGNRAEISISALSPEKLCHHFKFYNIFSRKIPIHFNSKKTTKYMQSESGNKWGSSNTEIWKRCQKRQAQVNTY